MNLPSILAEIVVAEDNPADVRLIREALEEYRIKGSLVVFTDGEKAIQYLDAIDAQLGRVPDLVIIDLNLPKKSGHEVLERMRRSVRLDHTPAIVLTSSYTREDRAEAVRLGASVYIRKPTHLQDFIDVGAIFKRELGQ